MSEIQFPPRNESLDFFRRLNDEKYRDQLHRMAVNNIFVDTEGTAVWMQEYLRYRVNGLGHIDACIKVFEQIDTIVNPNVPSYPSPSGYEGIVSVDGKGFRVNGKRWQYISLTAFQVFKNFLDGMDVTPFLKLAADLGNTVRITLTCKQMFSLDPRKIARFFGELVDFHDHAKSFGLNVENTIFADRHLFTDWDDPGILSFYNQAVQTLKNLDNKFLELVNEADQPENQLNVGMFPRPTGVISSRGSMGGDEDPVNPAWDYAGFHPNRTPDWPRKLKSPREFQDQWNIPVVNGENNRPDLAGFNISDFKDAGYVSALMCSGINLHSNALKYGQLPLDAEYNCLKAMSNAAKSVSPDIQFGHYTRGGLSDCPMVHSDDVATRTFAVIHDNEAHAVIVQPTASNPRKASNGWIIVDNRDNFYHLMRA